jgi:redox-sensitive bicupin YhaK (pirin superfamily)
MKEDDGSMIMSSIRKIKKVIRSKPTLEGAGVHLKRAFGNEHVPQFDPFLLLDDFHSDKRDEYIRGFPWHPHRGIETITYMLEGEVEHGDSIGNKGVISAGDVQWMTAGGGIIHQEMPKGAKDGKMWGLQLWANLPAAHKMTEPRYREVKHGQIPIVALDSGVKISVICGEIAGVKGPVQDIVIDPEYLDIEIPAGAIFSHRVKKGYTVFAYVLQGRGYFEPERDPYDFEMVGRNYFDFKRKCLIEHENLIIFQDGEELQFTTEEGVRFLLISGKPLNEPVAWYGPVVMNTNEELRIAFKEFQEGTFLKHE